MPLAFKILGLLPDTGTRGVPTPPEPLAFVTVQSGGINLTDVVTDLTLSSFPIVTSTTEHRALIVLIARCNVYVGPDTDILSVDWGTIGLTRFAAFGPLTSLSCGPGAFCARMEAYCLLNPAPSTDDIVIVTRGTDSTGAGIVASAWQFNGVNQGTPFGTVVNAGSQVEQHSLNVSSAVGEIVLGWIHARHNHDRTEPGGGQTNRYTEVHHGPASTDRHASSKGATLAGGPTVNVRWDNVGTNQDEAMTAGFGIKPAV